MSQPAKTRRCLVPGFALACLLALAQLSAPRAAQAWIFPEHMELTRFAYERDLPAIARAQLDAAIAAAIDAGLPLCRSIDPLERYLDSKRTCLPYTALPAFAGDHANARNDLSSLVRGDTGLAILEEVADAWKDYLSSAPPEVQRLYRSRAWGADTWQPSWENGGGRRAFTRELDIALDAIDRGYTSRAAGTRAHFQDSLTSIQDLFGQLNSRGNIDNALAQVFAHHIRSLQLALAGGRDQAQRKQLWTDALLEHVQALHFLQDAFAAGHIGTEHGMAVDVEKLRRHDFLNRAGLNIQRATLGSRCENVTAAGRNRAESSDATKAGCWVAYGDGYLDSYNARIIADAVARVQLQFAMAIGKHVASDPTKAWLAACPGPEQQNGPLGKPQGVSESSMKPAEQETDPTNAGPYVRFEGEGIAHVHRCVLGEAGENGLVPCDDVVSGKPAAAASKTSRWLRVEVYSQDFDPQLSIQRCADETCATPKKVASNSDISQFDLQASVEFEAEAGVVYEFVIGNDGSTPSPHGDKYVWRIVAVKDQVKPATRCGPLLRVAELLDPAPIWAQTEEERKRRASWSAAQQETWARYVVSSASAALGRLDRDPRRDWEGECKDKDARCLSSGGRSAANAGMELREILGDPLTPCRETALWSSRSHPLCSTSGGEFDFGSEHASLWRPLIVVWPTPMGDITVIEGKDAFGKGMAAEVVFGFRASAQTADDVAWAAAGWLGFGLSYRINNLFPHRENRSVVEANVALSPMVSMVPRSRLLLAGFVEGRVPILPFILARWFGTTSKYEFGPLGYRYYFQWPNQLPDGKGRFNAGHDLEIFNLTLDGGSGARNREAGHILDPELRVHVGLFREWFLLGEGEDLMPVLSLEFAWGHSTYFEDL